MERGSNARNEPAYNRMDGDSSEIRNVCELDADKHDEQLFPVSDGCICFLEFCMLVELDEDELQLVRED